MKTKLTQTKFKSAVARAGQLFCKTACLGAVILICASASAQNLFVSGSEPAKNCLGGCGAIFKFTWDGGQSIFASGLTDPWDVAFDRAGNLFVVDYDRSGLLGNAAVYKITSSGVRTTFASGLSYPSYLAVDNTGNVFVADYNRGVIYEYKPTGSRATFATGLHHPVGMAFNSVGNLFVVDNSAGMYLGHIYEYKPNGTRATFAILDPSDRPADLAFNSMGNLLVADLAGNVYRYDMGVLRPHRRTTFGSVPSSAQSLAVDTAGNLLVLDAGDINGSGTATPNAIYKFTPLGARSTFASGSALNETLACVAFQPPVCCQ
jgi:DNA-binding beta-propeller fold protein YncE